MDKPEVHIMTWKITNGKLQGRVVDHPRFESDTPVTTSSILKKPLNPKEGDKVETRNTIYILTGPSAL
jgi:hypothetical protein